MAYNKVVYDGNILIDLTDLDVTAGDVVSGVTFIMADGTKAVGNITIPTNTSDLVNDSGFITASDEQFSKVVTTTTHNTGAFTCNGNAVGTKDVTISSPTGYRAVCVVDIQSSASATIPLTAILTDATTVRIQCRNVTATAVSPTVYFKVLHTLV